MKQMLNESLNPIFYVTPDSFRSIGFEEIIPNYHLICLEDDAIAAILNKKGVKVFSYKKETGGGTPISKNTGILLSQPEVQEYIKLNSQKQPAILYFKPSKKIEALCQENNWIRLGNTESAAQIFEDKISFYKLCLREDWSVVPGEINTLDKLHYTSLAGKYGQRIIIQFGRGWAGQTTFLIDNENDLKKLQDEYPSREVRLTKFIQGLTFINNACVTKEEILVSPPAQQINQNDSCFGVTYGRQWPSRLSLNQEDQLESLTKKVGEKMREVGYRGLFGLDFLIDSQERFYLLENNARQTASISFYTQYEILNKKTPFILQHINEFLKLNLPEISDLKTKICGGELIIRNNKKVKTYVKDILRLGVYDFQENNLNFLREGCRLEDLGNNEEFLLLVSQANNFVKPGNEIARIVVRNELLDSKGHLKEKYQNVTKKVLDILTD